MARLLGAKCRFCRREGVKLFLKGRRCETVKCGFEKNPHPPGQHGAKRIRYTDYGRHLREKQKLKRFYGLSDRQFKRYFAEASRQPGNTGENLLLMLERRLDNIIYLARWATSRAQARQLITHGHITINERRVNIPSLLVRAGVLIKPINKPSTLNLIKGNLEEANKDLVPTWLRLSEDPLQIQVVQLPQRADVTAPINEQLVVEFASR